jgi:hypothetical protein
VVKFMGDAALIVFPEMVVDRGVATLNDFGDSRSPQALGTDSFVSVNPSLGRMFVPALSLSQPAYAASTTR